MEPDAVDGRRLVFTRRTLMKGGAAAGIVASAPFVPTFAWAAEGEPEVTDKPLELDSAEAVPDPVPHTHDGPDEAGSGIEAQGAPRGHRLVRELEADGARMVGVSWAAGPDHGSSIRWHGPGGWSDWVELHVDSTERPDLDEGGSPEAARSVSSPIWVDQADQVEVVLPDGVIDPVLHLVGESDRQVLSVQSTAADASPSILRRSAWGAAAFRGNPSIASALRLAIVHHTASGNDYTAAQVPAILRSVQAYHQNTNGWNDIAYNFLVDRFGRIWEGRAGGIDRAVIGGHTFGCNTGSVGVCYIGNLVNQALPPAAESAIASLLSWKFNQIHAVSPVGSTSFAPVSSNGASKFAAGVLATHPTVVGHSHFSSTQCPGQANTRIASVRSNLTRMEAVLGIDAAPGGGYWLTDTRGQAHPRRGAPFRGSMAGLHLNAPMIGLAPTADGSGYWMLARDGGIFAFGSASFYGSTGGIRLNQPVVGMSTSRTGRGYWLVASDGGIFAFGDAPFYGSAGGIRLNRPVVGMARTPTGRGYWLFASDGGIFAYGDAPFLGSAGGVSLEAPAVDVGVHPNGNGYWLVLSNGRVLAYNVPNHGRVTANASDPVVGIAVTPNGGGYWLARRSGTVNAFGNAS